MLVSNFGTDRNAWRGHQWMKATAHLTVAILCQSDPKLNAD